MAGKVLFAGLEKYRAYVGAGAGYIAGSVTVASVPGARWVNVTHRATNYVIASVFSGTDGAFRIDGLDPTQEFDVAARDWSQSYKDAAENSVHAYPYSGSPPAYPHGDYEPPAGNAVNLNLDTYSPVSSVIPYSVWVS